MAQDLQATYVRFPPDLHAEVKTYAADHDLSMAQVIRAAARAYISPAAEAVRTVLNVNGDANPPAIGDAVGQAAADALAPPPSPPEPDTLTADELREKLTELRQDCGHPKGARVALTAGLVRCGRCGMTRRANGSWS